MILSKNVARFIGNLGGKKFTVFPIDVGGAIIEIPNLGKVYTNIDTGHFTVDTPPKALSALKKAAQDVDCAKGTHYLTVEYGDKSFGIASNDLVGCCYVSVGAKELRESLEFVLPVCATVRNNPSMAQVYVYADSGSPTIELYTSDNTYASKKSVHLDAPIKVAIAATFSTTAVKALLSAIPKDIPGIGVGASKGALNFYIGDEIFSLNAVVPDIKLNEMVGSLLNMGQKVACSWNRETVVSEITLKEKELGASRKDLYVLLGKDKCEALNSCPKSTSGLQDLMFNCDRLYKLLRSDVSLIDASTINGVLLLDFDKNGVRLLARCV